MLSRLLRQLLRREPAAPGVPSAPPPDAGAASFAEAVQLYHLRRHAESVKACRLLLERDPANPDTLQLLAAGLFAQGLSSEAFSCLRRAVAAQPSSADAHATLASALVQCGELTEAVEEYRRAVGLRAGFVDAWHNLARLLKLAGNYDEAEDACRAGLQADEKHAGLHHVLSGVLFEQGRLAETETELHAALALNPDAPAIHSDLLRTFYYSDQQDPATSYREHRAWALRHARRLEAVAPPHTNDVDPDRRLRLGYVSPHFRKHAVTFFFETIIQHHDRANFEVFLYADVPQPDDYSRRLREYGSIWRSTVGLTDEQLAGLIRQDGIDILVDLCGHTPGNRLLAFARRPAPIQATSLTTGMASVDYRITDAYADPPGTTEHLHSEKPLRLPGFYSAWRPPDLTVAVGPLPALDSEHITFGSFNSCFKITPTVVALWSRILHEAPGSRLVLLAFNGEVASRRVRELFARHGIEPARLDFRPRMGFEEYFAARAQVDIALDTFPFHGCTTTCDTLWMGVPVVTLAGSTYFSRIGVSVLSNVGLPQLIAQTGDEYVEIARRLGTDLPALARLRADLRAMLLRSPVIDGPGCTRSLEYAYRQAWRAWCSERNA